MKKINFIGRKSGFLTVVDINYTKKPRYNTILICLCKCGKIVKIDRSTFVRGRCKSCGCYREDKYKSGGMCNKHNMSKTRIYRIWGKMKRRCKNKDNKNYGGRDIKVCIEWKNNFVNFYNWAIKNGYKDNLTIDRIDVNGNYCPENCRWATVKEQANNRRNNCFVFYNGHNFTVLELAEKHGIKRVTLAQRLKSGWDIERALKIPSRKI